jgi:phosphonate transport system ATP-binding protein
MQLDLLACAARHPASSPDSLALQPITLSIKSGEQVAVIGPSGAGKTTLLHVMACAIVPVTGFTSLPASLSLPTAGAIKLDDVDPWALSKSALQRLRGALFLAPQVPPLPPRQRVVTSVLAGQLPRMGLWTSLRSLFYPRDIPAAYAALCAFDLGEKLFDRVDRLSGGERQRVGLARALLSNASLWLIDEPLSALDPARGEQALSTLTSKARMADATLVATLHHVEMALKHFPRIIGMKDGAVAFDLPAAQVTPEKLQALYAQNMNELSLNGLALNASNVSDRTSTTPRTPTSTASSAALTSEHEPSSPMLYCR